MKIDVPIQSVSRFIALMRVLNANGPSSLSQLANATGLRYSTVLRIVQTMLRHDLIERSPQSKLYSVTAMALSLSHGFQPAHRIAAVAQPTLEALTQRIGWPVTILTRVGASMVVRAATNHLTSLSFGPCPPGSAVPVLNSSSGHAFLAHATADERANILDGLRRIEPRSPLLSVLVESDLLDRVRSDGFAMDERNAYGAHPGKTSSISVPLHDAGALQGTLTVVLFASAMPIDEAVRRYRSHLKNAAAVIEQALTAPDPPRAAIRPAAATTRRSAAATPLRASAFVPASGNEVRERRSSMAT